MIPFSHPTSVLVLDDDPLFLESLDFQFSDEVSCQTFTRPDAALQHLFSQEGQHPDFSRFFMHMPDGDQGSDTGSLSGDPLLKLELSQLPSIIDDPSRHQRVSVAIVDYDMPSMTGVEFCDATRTLPVRTILLTGKAGLETAIAAFNEGLIDCFLQKQDPNVTRALRREINRLQDEYFADIGAPIMSALMLKQPCPFTDPGFEELFSRLVTRDGIVEYCISGSPPGVLMRDGNDDESLLMILDGETLERQRDAATLHGAPAEMMERLRAGTAHAWFPTQNGLYHPQFASRWHQFIWPAEGLPGSSRYTFSHTRQSRSARDFLFTRAG